MSAQETFPPGSLVRKRPEWYLWHGITGRVVAVMPHPTTAMVRVQWANRAGPAWERADDLLPVPERPRDDNAERSGRVGGDQEQFPVGARVRLNGRPAWDGREGVVADPPFGHNGYPDMRYVFWEDNTYRWHDVDSLECAETLAPESPRAAARTLAPGVESRADVQGGKPCLAGTRTPTDVVRGWRGWEAFRSAHPHVTPEQYDRALLFEAGRDWQRERRRRRKERRAVRRWKRAAEAARLGGE